MPQYQLLHSESVRPWSICSEGWSCEHRHGENEKVLVTWSIRLIHSQASRVSQITLWTSTIPSKVLCFTFTLLFRVHTPGWIISVVRRKVCSIDWYFLLSPSKLNLTILVSGNKTNKPYKCREVRTGFKVIRVIYVSILTRTRME